MPIYNHFVEFFDNKLVVVVRGDAPAVVRCDAPAVVVRCDAPAVIVRGGSPAT